MSSDPTEAAKSPATNIPAVIKVAIIEDQRDIREGLAWIIRATEGFDCTGAFRSVEEEVEKIGFDLPHVVLTDIGLPGMSGVGGNRILNELERRQSQGEAYAVRPFDLKPTADWALR